MDSSYLFHLKEFQYILYHLGLWAPADFLQAFHGIAYLSVYVFTELSASILFP